MNSITRRVLATLAVVALAATFPAAGIAAADDRATDTRGWGLSSSLAANDALVAAVAGAREDYRASALAARQAFRASAESTRLDILDDTAAARASVKETGDAFRAISEGRATGEAEKSRAAYADALASYRAAVAAARTTRQGQLDTAMAAAKSSLAMARTRYSTAIAAAFTEFAPSSSVPRALLDPTWWVGVPDSTWLAGERA